MWIVACEKGPKWGTERRQDRAPLARLANFSFRPMPHLEACSQTMWIVFIFFFFFTFLILSSIPLFLFCRLSGPRNWKNVPMASPCQLSVDLHCGIL